MSSNEAKTLLMDQAVALNVGAPGPRHLKKAAQVMTKATEHLMASNDGQTGKVMAYGPELGMPCFRDNLAKFLSESYGDNVKSDDVMQTAGATHGLHLVASFLFQSGAPIFLEDPTYFHAITLLKLDMSMNIVPVPTDNLGIIPEAFDDLLTQYRSQAKHEVTDERPFWSMLYCITVFNNPQGKSLPPDRCRKLIRVARKHDILLFVEDVYNLLNYTEGYPPPRLLSYDKVSDIDFKGHVISNGTFSKILAPAVRVGWIETSKRIMKILSASILLLSGGAVSHYASQVISVAMETGLEQAHLRLLQSDLTGRMKAVCSLLREEMSDILKFEEPKGGYFIWLELPEKCSAKAIAVHSKEKYQVQVLPGNKCSVTGQLYGNCLRISVAHYETEVLLIAVRKLCKSIRENME